MKQDVEQFVGKKVIFTLKLDEPNEQGHSAVEVEGQILEANSASGMLFFRPKGKTMGTLVKMDQVEGDIKIAPTTLRPIKVKPLKNMTLDTVRQHLADRHGVSVEMLNTASDKNAMDMHNAIHAENKDLGHNHGEPSAKTED